MKSWRWKVLAGIGAFAISGAWLLSRHGIPERELDKTRQALRHDGFKLDLSDFDWSLPPEIARRAALLARTTKAELTNRLHPDSILGEMRDFPPPLTVLGANRAVATWQIEDLKGYSGKRVWPQLQIVLNASEPRLQKARQAALSGTDSLRTHWESLALCTPAVLGRLQKSRKCLRGGHNRCAA